MCVWYNITQKLHPIKCLAPEQLLPFSKNKLFWVSGRQRCLLAGA